MTALPTVSVVIPTRGRPELVADLARRLLRDPATTELVVVIDGNDPATEVALKPLGDVDSRLRVVKGLSGKDPTHREGRARNVGLQNASGSVVLALDDDVVPTPELVTGHARWHLSAHDLVVLGYMPVVSRSERVSAASRLVSKGYEQACAAFERDPDGILLGLWGGNFSVRREHWLVALEHSGFGGVYHEDRELGLLFHQAGLRGVFDRRLRADQLHDGSVEQCIANARLSAAAQVRLHRLFPDLVEDPALPQGSRLGRGLVDALGAVTARPGVWRWTALVLAGGVRVSARLKLSSTEWLGTRLLRRLSFERGLREALGSPRGVRD